MGIIKLIMFIKASVAFCRVLASAVFETWTGVHRNVSWRSIDFKWRLPGSCIKPNEKREVTPCRLTIKPANEQPSRSRYKTRSRGPCNENKRKKKVQWNPKKEVIKRITKRRITVTFRNFIVPYTLTPSSSPPLPKQRASSSIFTRISKN